MRKLILLALICASFKGFAQTYKTVTMALDTPTNVAILRAGTQSLDLNAKFQLKLISGTNIKSINGTSLLGSGNFVIAGTDSTVFRTVLNSLSLAQAQTALNLKANLSGATFTGAVSGASLTLSGAGTVGGNLAVTGTTTLTGNTRINGLVSLNGSPVTNNQFTINGNFNANTSVGGFDTRAIVTSTTTSSALYNNALLSTQAAAFTLGEAVMFNARGLSFGAGSSINNVYGFRAQNNLNVGTAISASYSGEFVAAANAFNLYMSGSAKNYLNGTTLIGTLTDNGVDKLQVTGSASVSTRFGIGVSSTSTFFNLPAGVTTSSSFRMPYGVAPTTPVSGDFWNLTTGLRTQTYDGTQTKDVLYDKANAVFADGIVGAIIADGAGNFSKAPVADRTTSNTQLRTASGAVVLSDFGANGTLIIRADATAGAITITLPTATIMAGLTITVKKVDATANTVTISATSIDGVTTKVLSGLNVFTSITSNGTVFNIVGDKVTDATVAGTGWADYTDGLYTLASPLSIASGTTATLTNNAATSVTSQLPVGVTSLYNSATSKITPAGVGDAYGISIRFKAKSTSPTDFFDFGVDVGGAVGVIFKQTRTFIKGANTEVAFDININAFSLATFVANGGLVKITAGNGTMTVYSIVYDIFRTHKAY